LAALLVDLDTAGHTLRLLVRGDVDLVNHDQLREALNIAVEATGRRPIEVDLSGVTFLDAAGVGLLMGAYKAALRRRLTLRVDGASGIVLRVLEITGAAPLLFASRSRRSG
jgi:anti-anti-sigma factor